MASHHERTMKHIKDAKDFSPKSHIIKNWRIMHLDFLDMPRMEFKITGRYKDALSRQVAMEIFYSRDHILNSKSEYIKNCINRLTVNKPEWERKEREEADEII